MKHLVIALSLALGACSLMPNDPIVPVDPRSTETEIKTSVGLTGVSRTVETVVEAPDYVGVEPRSARQRAEERIYIEEQQLDLENDSTLERLSTNSRKQDAFNKCLMDHKAHGLDEIIGPPCSCYVDFPGYRTTPFYAENCTIETASPVPTTENVRAHEPDASESNQNTVDINIKVESASTNILPKMESTAEEEPTAIPVVGSPTLRETIKREEGFVDTITAGHVCFGHSIEANDDADRFAGRTLSVEECELVLSEDMLAARERARVNLGSTSDTAVELAYYLGTNQWRESSIEDIVAELTNEATTSRRKFRLGTQLAQEFARDGP